MATLRQATQEEERADVFGEKGDFWARYDRLADKYDADMLQRLNDNLDVLLIFVSDSS